MSTVKEINPNIFCLEYRQDKEDADYGSCLWARFLFNLDKYELNKIERGVYVDARKYTKEQALEIVAGKLEVDKNLLVVKTAWIRYGFGRNSEGEIENRWWVAFEPKGKSTKVWAVMKVREGK